MLMFFDVSVFLPEKRVCSTHPAAWNCWSEQDKTGNFEVIKLALHPKKQDREIILNSKVGPIIVMASWVSPLLVEDHTDGS